MHPTLRGCAPVAAILALAACAGGSASPASSPSAASSNPASVPVSAPARPSGASPTGAPSGNIASGTSAIPSVPAGQTVRITIATGVPSAAFTPIWVALDKGYFKKYGLDVKHERVEGVVQAQAIMADEVQIGVVGGTEVLDTRVGGSDLISIKDLTRSPVFEIHAPPSTKTLDELRGKTIAITRPGSSTDMATRVILANHHLAPDQDVKLLAANNMPGILAALQTGQVQAGTMSPPTTVKATEAGFPKLVSAVDEHVPIPQGTIVLRKSYADSHPAVVYAYLKGLEEGTRDFFNNPSTAIAAIAKYTESSQSTAKGAYEAVRPAMDPIGLVDPEGFRTIQKYGKNTKTRELDVTQAFDNHFLQALKDSGFINNLAIKSGS